MAEVQSTSSVNNGEELKAENQARLKQLMAAIREANKLPKKGGDFEMLSSFPGFAELMKVEGDRILKMMNLLCRNSGCKINFLSDGKMDEDEMMDKLIDANDAILERVGNFLDEAEGRRKKEDLIVVVEETPTIRTSWNRQIHQKDETPAKDETKSLAVKRTAIGDVKYQAPSLESFQLSSTNKIIKKPQIQFQSHIDNTNVPFRSKLKQHHNKLTKGSQIKLFVDGEKVDSAASENPDLAEDLHPYRMELMHYEPIPAQLLEREPQKPLELEKTPLNWVDTVEQLEELCRVLKSVPEFAVDLEHHDYRSFLGLTCLVQISTRTDDYIVDPLAVWPHMHLLNDPFTDPNIVKVFHGSNKDILWLQRDFGIYVVNMFDTGQAMRNLKFHKFSLYYLVNHYLSVNLQKEHQLADWRIRPLPEELINYARSDTHHLLYCYDMLSNELLKRSNCDGNMLRNALSNSRDICLQVYQKPLYDPENYQKVYQRCKQRFNARQIWALRELYGWRDRAARLEDESYGYVIPDHMLLQIAEVLPKEMSGILACCSPVPPLVRKEQHEIYRIILKAREKPLDAKNEKSLLTPKLIQKQSKHPLIHAVHDFSHASREEEIESLNERLKSSGHKKFNLLKPVPTLDVGSSMAHSISASGALAEFNQSSKKRKKTASKPREDCDVVRGWVSPYEKYLLAVEAAKELEAAEAEKKKQEEEDEKKNQAESSLNGRMKEEEEKEADDDLPEVVPKKPKKQKSRWGTLFDPDRLSQFKAVDYEKVDGKVFKEKPKTKPDVFDPQKTGGDGKKGKGKRTDGKKKSKFGNMLEKTFSFGSKKKK